MRTLFGSGFSFVFMIVFIAIILLWLLSIKWAGSDAKARGANPKTAKLISIIPFIGVLAYILMRPPLYLVDKEEQELDIMLKRAQLSEYIVCPDCGRTIPNTYVACPYCGTEVKVSCKKCGKPLDTGWRLCPYCGNKEIGQLSSSPFSDNFSDSDLNDSRTQQSAVPVTNSRKFDIPEIRSDKKSSSTSGGRKIKNKTSFLNNKK